MEEWKTAELPTLGAPILQIFARKRPIANVCRWEYPDQDAEERRLQRLIASTPKLFNCLNDLVAWDEREYGRDLSGSTARIMDLDKIISRAKDLIGG